MRYSTKRYAARVLLAVVCVSGSVFSTVAATSADQGTVSITAEMEDASPLRNGNIVRASGVEVGTVDSVTLGPDRKPRVAMTVGREVLPLHQDASATVIDGDLLGERYVSINPGTPSAPAMSEPYTISIEHTRSVVDLQKVVDVVDNPSGTGLGMLMTTLGEGLGTDPKATAATLASLRPALERTDELAKVLSGQNEVLSRLVQSAQPVAEAAATQRGESLDRLVGSTTNLLSVTAANRDQIQDSLKRLPSTLQSAQRTLAEVAGLAPPTTSTLKELRPITDDLVDISGELEQFSKAADPALSTLRPVLDKGKELLDEARPVAEDLHRGSNGLRGVITSYRKLADGGLSTRLVDLMEFAKGWTLSINDYDAVSHYFKATLPYSPKTGAQTALGPIPGAPAGAVPNFPLPRGGRIHIPGGDAEGAPKEDYPAPSLPGMGTGATGLSQKQEQGMMDQLLGGK
jgi:phospholipid/cholesterol/gamma-HCH transport system substrate-binding protein